MDNYSIIESSEEIKFLRDKLQSKNEILLLEYASISYKDFEIKNHNKKLIIYKNSVSISIGYEVISDLDHRK